MARKVSIVTKFLAWSARMAANPNTFITALVVIIGWFLAGLILGMNDTWLLIINTVATINATLMVFIIQNTQYREGKALHIKIDELIRVTKEAENELIAIEEMEEEDLEAIRKKISEKPKNGL
jgi:low affinity Fe/Cu permease